MMVEDDLGTCHERVLKSYHSGVETFKISEKYHQERNRIENE